MALNVQSVVGPSALAAADAGNLPLRADKQGGLAVTELQARYYEQTYRANTFMASNSAAQAVSVALATTYTGLCLSNPLENTKNVVLLTVGTALTVAPAAIASLHLITGFSKTTAVTHTTPVAPQTGLVGSRVAASALVDAAATIPTPVYSMSLMGGFTAAALPSSPNTVFAIEGAIILSPGAFVAVGALTAVTGIFSFSWMEVPV